MKEAQNQNNQNKINEIKREERPSILVDPNDDDLINEDEIGIYDEDEMPNDETLKIFKLMTDGKFFEKKDNNTIVSKENYLIVIKLIEDLEGKDIIYFSRYLKALDIVIQKVLINGYLEYDFENEENILTSILRVINVLYDKDTFNCIYNKFSEIYRRHKDINSPDSIKKFNKIMKVWELLYDVDPSTTNIKENGSILLLPQKEKEEPNIYFKLPDFKFQRLEIQINFFPTF